MKSRVSHFITKNIEVNSSTRPTPPKIQYQSKDIPCSSSVRDTRVSLTEKLGLQPQHLNIKKTSGRKILGKHLDRKSTPTKNKEQRLFAVEATYAAHPQVKKSLIIAAAIRYEVAVLNRRLWQTSKH